MQVKVVKVKNFRNLEDQTIEFGPGLNVISGENGAGKTNLLEAIYLTSIGRSPRTRKDAELITTGKRGAEVKLEYSRGGVDRSVTLSLSATKPKVVALDDTVSTKISDVVGNFASVYFSPDELEIVRGTPQYRRRFMDIINCQIGAGYMVALRNFLHALKQRNALLQGINNATKYDSSLLPWDRQISAYSIRIMLRRANFVRNLDKLSAIAMRILTNNKETLHCTYKTFFDRLTDINVNTFDEVYQTKCRAAFLRDIATKSSSIGPHHDDIEIKLGYIAPNTPVEGRDVTVERWINLRTSGSMGQQRSATLALKIAEMYLYKKYYGEKPVLLLDDVLSELDEDRQRALMQYCNTFNTIITCTEWHFTDLEYHAFEVKDGVVTRSEEKHGTSGGDADLDNKILLIEQAFENENLGNVEVNDGN